jgi:hypothetical protein
MASAAGTRALLTCGIVGVCAALFVLRAGPALAQRDGSGNTNPPATVPTEVRELWREYPLNPTPPPSPPPQPAGQRLTESGSSADADSDLIPFAIAAAVGVAAVALVALAVLAGLRPAWAADFRIPKLRPGARPRRRVKRRQERLVYANLTAGPSRPDVSPTPQVEPEPLSSEPKGDKLELDSADAGERNDAMKIVKSATPEQGDQNESYAQVGEQVASVLAAAHRAADEIRATALEEAERIRDEAEADAASSRDEAGRAAEQTRRESEALRAEADEYSREAREAADRYVATTREQIEDEAANRRAESEQEAREKHRSAEQRAREIETEALERRKAIIEEAERSQARLEQLLGVFRGMTSRLEELLGAEQAGGEAANAQDDSGGDEIAEDLRPRRSRTGTG